MVIASYSSIGKALIFRKVVRRFFRFQWGFVSSMEAVRMAGTRGPITIGDLFRKTNSTNWVWRVCEIFAPAGHCPHARITRLIDPSDERVFSLAALKDKRLFISVERSKHADAVGHRSFVEREPSSTAVAPALAIKKAS